VKQNSKSMATRPAAIEKALRLDDFTLVDMGKALLLHQMPFPFTSLAAISISFATTFGCDT